jgi:hypothetical protein
VLTTGTYSNTAPETAAHIAHLPNAEQVDHGIVSALTGLSSVSL